MCRNLKMATLYCEIKETRYNDINNLQQDYPKQFDCISHFLVKSQIVLKPTIISVIHALRKCPIHLKDEIKKGLDKMVKNRVIKKVEKSTDCSAAYLIAGKATDKRRFASIQKI